MNRHFTSTRFIQYSYFNAISKLAPAIYQNNIYILYKCIIPNYIVGYIVFYILNTTIIAHRYIMQSRMIQSGMFTHATRQHKLVFKNSQSDPSRKTGMTNIVRLKVLYYFNFSPINRSA